MKILLVLPILVPLLTATLCILNWRRRKVQRRVSAIGATALLIASLALLAWVRGTGIQSTQSSGWPAPFGITLVSDLFSAIMVVLAGLVGLAVVVYSLPVIDARREAYGYHPLLHILLLGVCGAFLTGDIFNLYVWFEVMLMASFVLLGLGGQRGQLEGAMKYVTLNFMSSAIFLASVGILYGLCGTLNMADLARRLGEVDRPGLVNAVALLFFVAFGIKSAVFPLFFWLPASYHTPPVPVSAIFAGLLTKVGVYAMIRVFTLLFVQDPGYTHTLILVIAGFTMVTGVLGAVAQSDFRRVLSFHIVSQIGYMIMGLGLFTPLALAGSIFYIMHHIIVKTNLFLISGVAQRLHGKLELRDLGGLYRTHPWVSILFLIPALSLAGMPPLSGFFAKLALVQAGLDDQEYLIVFVSLAVSLLTLLSMTKIWAEAFWKDAPKRNASQTNIQGLLPPITALAAITVLIGLGAGPMFALASLAAEQLLQPAGYVEAVLGWQP